MKSKEKKKFRVVELPKKASERHMGKWQIEVQAGTKWIAVIQGFTTEEECKKFLDRKKK